jgi:general secretion pathway protein G
MRSKAKRNLVGFTLIELVITVLIVAILGSAAMPMIQLNVKRSKETELRRSLWQLRDAIDAYKKAADEGVIETKIDQTGYPPNLTVLVEGVENLKDPDGRKIKFLRRIPIDPMLSKEQINTEDVTTSWGLRSYASDSNNPEAGEDVYDIYSLSKEVGINGVPYAKW